MQAVILVGGEGTRLRPLTSTVPKPVVPLVDRPFISFMLDWLVRHGVDDVIMSCGFLASGVRNVLGDGSDAGVRLRFVEEPDPRGTAGALKYAEPLLDERFVMLNGDVLTDLDLTAQIAQHEQHWHELIQFSEKLLALNPVSFPDGWFSNALGNFCLQNFAAAEKSARRGLEVDSEHRVIQLEYLMGVILLKRSDYDGAAQHLRIFMSHATRPTDIAEAQKQLDETARLSAATRLASGEGR